MMTPSPRTLQAVAANLVRKFAHGQVADLRPMPAEVIDAGPGRTVRRYRGPRGLIAAGPPVLLVPPPAAPARCFDLRRGCSLAEHLVTAGRRTYLLEHRSGGAGPAAAIEAVARNAGGQPVQLVGWSLGGLQALLAAADPALPVASVALVAVPGHRPAPRPGPRWAPSRLDEAVAGRLFGPVPGPLPERVPGRSGVEKYIVRPYQLLTRLDDTDFLAQSEAFDHFENAILASSGRPWEGAATALLRDAGEADGERWRPALDGVRVPVLAIAGRDDRVAPPSAVPPLERLLPNAPEVRFTVAPGGHVGVLTGADARTTTWAHLDRWLDEGIVRHGLRRRAAAGTR